MASEKCSECNKPVETMAFKGAGVCGELCRKRRDGETPEVRSQTDAGITGLLRKPEGLDPRAIS